MTMLQQILENGYAMPSLANPYKSIFYLEHMLKISGYDWYVYYLNIDKLEALRAKYRKV